MGTKSTSEKWASHGFHSRDQVHSKLRFTMIKKSFLRPHLLFIAHQLKLKWLVWMSVRELLLHFIIHAVLILTTLLPANKKGVTPIFKKIPTILTFLNLNYHKKFDKNNRIYHIFHLFNRARFATLKMNEDGCEESWMWLLEYEKEEEKLTLIAEDKNLFFFSLPQCNFCDDNIISWCTTQSTLNYF